MVESLTLPSADLRGVAGVVVIDWTILEIAPTPGAVSVPASWPRTPPRLARATAGALALVSGRSLGDIDLLFAPLRLPAIGGHGAEFRLSPNDARETERAHPLDGRLRNRLAELAVGAPGLLVEDKGYSLAVHYRLAPEQEARVKQAVAAINADWPEQPIEVLPGKSVVEIKPAGFHKGAAIRELMRHEPFAGRRPIFVGDDTTDESAFAVMPEFNGMGFSVGRHVPGTAHCFAAPSDVRRWLEHLSGGEESRPR
jgi:trehalose 6-phosphate phosphatase